MARLTKTGVFSFFAGAGFLDLGFETTGHYETLLANEFHAPFMEIYKAAREPLGIPPPVFGHHVCDIAAFLEQPWAGVLKDQVNAAKKTHRLTGFIGGPPCPDFSVGGKNKGASGENGRLSGTFVELIIKNQPCFFLFENVKGLYRTKKHRQFFEELKARLAAGGYCFTEKVINALEYGVPQDRSRLILIGFRREVLQQLGNSAPAALMETFNWDSHRTRPVSEVLSLHWPGQEPFVPGSDKPCPPGIDPSLTVEHWFRQNQTLTHPNAAHFFRPKAGLARFQAINEGDSQKKSYKRLHRWRYAPTAAYGNNEVHLHPYQARRISVAEALAIQSLPREFAIPPHLTLTNMFKAVGNGVPFLAAKGLAGAIMAFADALGRGQAVNAKAG